VLLSAGLRVLSCVGMVRDFGARILALRFHSARFRSLRQQPFREIEPFLRLAHFLPECLHLVIQRLKMGSGVSARAGDAALGHNLRDLDCAPRPNCSDEYDDDGGEKNLWVHVAFAASTRGRYSGKTYGWALEGATGCRD